MKYYAYFLISIAILVLSGCKNSNQDDTLEVVETPLFQEYTNYLVSTESYIRVYQENNERSVVMAVVRRGDLFILLDTAGKNDVEYGWYYVKNNKVEGWIFTLTPMLVYSLEKATFFSNILSQNRTID